MPPYTSLIAVALSALTLSSARPLVARSNHGGEYCSPNFEGANVSVVQQDKEWEARSNSAGAEVFIPSASKTGINAPDWRFEQTGQPKTAYVIKDVTDTSNSLVIAARDGKLKLETFTWNNDPAQTWEVVCDSCEGGISGVQGFAARTCKIIDSANGRCVTAGSESLDLAPCNGGDNQKWDFITQNDGGDDGGDNFAGGDDEGDEGEDDGEETGDDGAGDDGAGDEGAGDEGAGADDAGADDAGDDDANAGADDAANAGAGDDGAGDDDAGDDAGDNAGKDGAANAGAKDDGLDNGEDDGQDDDGQDDADNAAGAGEGAAGDDDGQEGEQEQAQ